jgi:DNA topoisomerase-1
MVVNDFLIKYFDTIMDYNFTAKVEEQFDIIAEGKEEWENMLGDFYKPFHQQVEKTLEVSEKANGERKLGIDPKTGKPVFAKIGRFGPMVQLGETGDADDENAEKPKFASLQSGMRLETITLEQALDLFKLPRELGEYEDKKVTAAIGRFGPYVRHDNKFVSIGKNYDPFTITLDQAIELIEAKREKDRKAVIKTFDEEPEIRVLNGRWGPYISYKKKNYKIPKNTDAEKLSLDNCREIIEKGPTPRKKTKKKK